MKLTADTNLLVRAMTEDDPHQSRLAQNEHAQAELVAVTLPALCEMVWVLARGYKIGASDIAAQIRILLACETVATDRPAVEAGLALLDESGDFADGVIACEGTALGADEFVSFDKRAVALLQARGKNARLLL
nr:type II toxin-antitoxin system VapC family toxin [uncultured Rhodopila sp.]